MIKNNGDDANLNSGDTILMIRVLINSKRCLI